MQKRLLAGLMLALLAGPVLASTYNYTESGMDGADWTIMSNGSWLGWATPSQGADWRRITYSWSADGAGMGSQVAVVWTAPVGETISQIDFDYTYNADPSFFTPVVYRMTASDTALSTGTPVAWQGSSAGWIQGSESLTFSPADNVQKVALGLIVPKWGYSNYLVEFSNAVITTVPEPATLGLMVLGGLFLRRKS